MSTGSDSKSIAHNLLGRLRTESHEVEEYSIGCPCMHCNRHSLLYSIILLMIFLMLFVCLIVCIFVYVDEDLGPIDTNDYDYDEHLEDEEEYEVAETYDEDHALYNGKGPYLEFTI